MSIVPTVALPFAIPFTDQVTDWLVLPVTVAENCTVSPPRRVGLEGTMLIPLEVGFDVGLEEPPTFMPPPQPAHRAIAKDKTSALANLVREDVAIPIISDPLS
jgi:hypothetical protein